MTLCWGPCRPARDRRAVMRDSAPGATVRSLMLATVHPQDGRAWVISRLRSPVLRNT